MLIRKENAFEAAGLQMRRKTGQIEHSLSVITLHRHLAQQARFRTSSSGYSPAQRKGGRDFFPTLSQLIASLFPNKSLGGIFFGD